MHTTRPLPETFVLFGGIYRLKQGLEFHHHSWAAAIWPVVNSAMPVLCIISRIPNREIHYALIDRSACYAVAGSS